VQVPRLTFVYWLISCNMPCSLQVLFVCLGNICRSPSAEAVFASAVEKAGLVDKYDIDSCGTGGGMRAWYRTGTSYHEGDPADARMTAAAAKRGVQLTSVSRPMM
jgi:protein-tyrosine phosphatase